MFASSRRYQIRFFFLSCAIVAGAFGACTLTYKTLLLQTLPGVVALAAVWATRTPADHS